MRWEGAGEHLLRILGVLDGALEESVGQVLMEALVVCLMGMLASHGRDGLWLGLDALVWTLKGGS